MPSDVSAQIALHYIEYSREYTSLYRYIIVVTTFCRCNDPHILIIVESINVYLLIYNIYIYIYIYICFEYINWMHTYWNN